MKTYQGIPPHFVVVEDKFPRRDLNPRLDLRNHSPDGFNWGYGGSGPSQLALALCADLLGDDEAAKASYMGFKDRFVAKLPQNTAWTATEEELRKHLNPA